MKKLLFVRFSFFLFFFFCIFVSDLFVCLCVCVCVNVHFFRRTLGIFRNDCVGKCSHKQIDQFDQGELVALSASASVNSNAVDLFKFDLNPGELCTLRPKIIKHRSLRRFIFYFLFFFFPTFFFYFSSSFLLLLCFSLQIVFHSIK